MSRATRALIAKELLLERRSPQVVPAMALFSLSTFVVFHFALQRDRVDGELAAGVLTATLLFASILGIGRLFVADHEEGGFDGFLLAPVDRTSMLVAKVAVMMVFLALLELVAVPAFALLLLDPALSLELTGRTALVLLLVNGGVAVIGTLVGALAVRTRARDLLVPLIGLPLLLPVVIACSELLASVFAPGGEGLAGRWLLILALYDLVFGLLAYAIFDYLLED